MPFLLLPVITSYLNPSEYGTLSIYFLAISIYTAFIGMNMHTNISKNFFKSSKEELALYIGNIFFILLGTFSLSLLCTGIMSLFYKSIFSIPIYWLFFVPLISALTMINTMNMTILRNEQRAYIFGAFELLQVFMKLSLTILFLIVFLLNWYAQVLSTVIVSGLFFVIGFFYMNKRRYISLRFNMQKVKSILKISLPLIPHVLGGTIIAMSDRLFIKEMVGLEAVGIYSIGYMFGMIILLFTDAFIKAWSPWFYKKLVKPTETDKKSIVRYTYVYIILVLLLAIVIAGVSHLVLPYVVDEKFYGASEYIFWIAIAYAINGIYQIFFPYIVHIEKTSFLAISTLIAAVLNIIFNYFLIKYFGTIGAAYATVISFSFSAVFVFWYQSRHYQMPWFKLTSVKTRS